MEGQIGAKAELGRDVQLDHLLPVPARHHVEPAVSGKELALRADRDLDIGKVRQAAAQELHIAPRRDDQQPERLAVAPMLGQRFDQQTGAFKVTPALKVAQSQRQDGLTNFRKHWLGNRNYKWASP